MKNRPSWYSRMNLLVFHDSSILLAQNRQEHFPFQLSLDGVPIDIEERRVMGTRAVLQDIRHHALHDFEMPM